MSDETSTVYPKVVKRQRSNGPHGLGDPDNYDLRKVEKDILIPQIVRDRSRKEKCAAEVAAFERCGVENHFKSFIKCKTENKIMLDCLTEWFHNEEFHKECREENLKERSEYRRTGMSKKQRDYMDAKKVQTNN